MEKNGIITKTKETVESTKGEETKERIRMAFLSATAKKDGYTKQDVEEALRKAFGNDFYIDDSNKDRWIITANGQSVEFPAEYFDEDNRYLISFNSNGGSGTMQNQIMISEYASNINENTFTKEGYIFTGWNTTADGNGETYSDKQSISITKNITLYAQWREAIITELKTGQTINNKMKSLAGSLNNIIYIKKANSIEEQLKIESNNIAKNTSLPPVYMWYESGNIWYYTDADEIYLNSEASYMFNNITKVKHIDLYFKTNNATTTKQMFYNCNALESIDVSKFNTANVNDMSSMFGNCYKLEKLDLGNFDTAKVTNTNNMFNGSNNIKELNVTSFNTEKLNTMSRMFSSMKSLKELDVSSFNTSKVTNMEKCFDNMFELTTIYASSSFVTTSATTSGKMFINDSKLVGGNGTKYNSSYVDKTYAVIDSATTPGYFTDIMNKNN